MGLSPKQQTIHFLTLIYVSSSGAAWRTAGPARPCHGFSCRCWDQVVAKLPPDWQVFAVDMRGHGRSSNSQPFTWEQFGDDLLRVCERLKLKDAIGVGHSMGGHCITHVTGHNAAFLNTLAR